MCYFRHALGEGNQKQREIKTLKRDLDRKDDDLGETTRLRDAVARENKRVQEDLVTMTAENQVGKTYLPWEPGSWLERRVCLLLRPKKFVISIL
jgi:uncharacterized protein YwgA